MDRQEVEKLDKVDGDIVSLIDRIANIRLWTYISNRTGWLSDPQVWQERTRQIENRLSDALHERITQRFVDQRTSLLVSKLKHGGVLESIITGFNLCGFKLLKLLSKTL